MLEELLNILVIQVKHTGPPDLIEFDITFILGVKARGLLRF